MTGKGEATESKMEERGQPKGDSKATKSKVEKRWQPKESPDIKSAETNFRSSAHTS